MNESILPRRWKAAGVAAFRPRAVTALVVGAAFAATVAAGCSSEESVTSPRAAPCGERRWTNPIAFTADADGEITFDAANNGDIFVVEADGSRRTQLTRDRRNDLTPTWSPDGEQIAFRSARTGNDDIFVMRADGSGQRNLTRSPTPEISPAWSPDGRAIAYGRENGGDMEIYVHDLASGETRNVSRTRGTDEYPTWSPDGRRIAFQSDRDGDWDIYVMNADGSGQTRITSSPGEDSYPAWSPDGALIAFGSNAGAASDIYVARPDGSGRRRLTTHPAGDGFPSWAPDGRTIVFASDREAGRARERSRFAPPRFQLYLIGADGRNERRLVSSAGTDLTPAWGASRCGLFAYDAAAPLDVRESTSSDQGSLRISTVTYASPAGGRVPALIVAPREGGRHAGLILQHGMPSRKEDMLGLAQRLAATGAVVIAIDAPFVRRDIANPVLFTGSDRREQLQLIVDLRRAVDVLRGRDDVDGDRIGYLGVSYGGAMGGLLAGVEGRIAAYVLMVGDGGLVSHFTGPEDAGGPLAQLPAQARSGWLAAMRPIEPIRWVGRATAPVLFQSGRMDDAVPPRDARAFQRAGPRGSDVRWYDSGHFLPDTAVCDAARWLERRIGLDADVHAAC